MLKIIADSCVVLESLGLDLSTHYKQLENWKKYTKQLFWDTGAQAAQD